MAISVDIDHIHIFNVGLCKLFLPPPPFFSLFFVIKAKSVIRLMTINDIKMMHDTTFLQAHSM